MTRLATAVCMLTERDAWETCREISGRLPGREWTWQGRCLIATDEGAWMLIEPDAEYPFAEIPQESLGFATVWGWLMGRVSSDVIRRVG